MVIRETSNGEEPEEYLKETFPGWLIVHLKYPLRTSKTNSEFVKNLSRNDVDGLLKNGLNSSLYLTANMTLGPQPQFIQIDGRTLCEMLKWALSFSNKPASIILDACGMNATRSEIVEAKISLNEIPAYRNLVRMDDEERRTL